MGGEEEYDVVVVGAGSGGVRAARFAAKNYGQRTAVVELPFAFVSGATAGGAGGTCVIRGCVPKKLFVYGSEFGGGFSDSRGFGWALDAPNHSWGELLEKKNKEIERLNGIYGRLLRNSGVDVLEGRGRLLGGGLVEVAPVGGAAGDRPPRVLRAKNILVATGGRPARLEIPGQELAITSDEALVLEKLPKKIVIVGAGYIAVEFAGIFAGFGAEVHLVYRRDLPLRGFDRELRECVAENLAKRGVHLHPQTSPLSLERGSSGGGVRVQLKEGGGDAVVVDACECMFAVGRVPLVADLGLEEAGVELKGGAVAVDDLSRTSAPGVWAVGDCTDRLNLTPVALMEGMAFAATACGGVPTKPDHNNVACAVFCQPPLAKVGLSEEEAVEACSGPIDIYVEKFRPMKHTVSGRDERSIMKLVVDADSGRVLGAHMVGADAPEIMQGMAVALKCGATKAQFDATVGIHPTSAEEFVTMRTKARQVQGTSKL